MRINNPAIHQLNMKNAFVSVSLIVVGICLIFESISCQSKDKSIHDFNANVALDWNALIMDLAVTQDGLLTLNGVRTEALAFIAMHNALNAIKPEYATYHFSYIEPSAHPVAASAQAAYEIAVATFPNSRPRLDELLHRHLEAIDDGHTVELGIQLGQDAARQILARRDTDKWNEEADYTWHPMAPGVYAEFNEHSGTPEGFIFGAGWANAEPFMLTSQDQFRSPPPPATDSPEYAVAFNEVKAFGATHSAVRSDDQTHLAMWWKDFVEHSHNRLARDLIAKEQLNLWQAARCLALMNMGIYDAYVNVFDNKFHYNHWRPYTAIRWADHDNNAGTEQDEEWNNLHLHTYAFPSYPSAHGTASSAAMRVLSQTLGTGDDYSFSMTTEEVDSSGPMSEKLKMDPPTRTFSSFTGAGLEASMSRVYLGIHFRYDSEEGHRLGNSIGDFASSNFLTPMHE